MVPRAMSHHNNNTGTCPKTKIPTNYKFGLRVATDVWKIVQHFLDSERTLLKSVLF